MSFRNAGRTPLQQGSQRAKVHELEDHVDLEVLGEEGSVQLYQPVAMLHFDEATQLVDL